MMRVDGHECLAEGGPPFPQAFDLRPTQDQTGLHPVLQSVVVAGPAVEGDHLHVIGLFFSHGIRLGPQLGKLGLIENNKEQ